MNPRQLEIWALNVIDLVKSGKSNEDDLVELKTELPELPKKNRKNDPEIQKENTKAKEELSEIARRIAGHANAARGEDILWLIGIDQKSETNKIPGFNNNIDLADWYPYIQKHFIELSPKLTTVNVPIDDKIILALGFETDRSPFVVKNQNDHNFNEVPWREGTRVRSARRSDLILLLSPIEKLPDVEIVNKGININRRKQGREYIEFYLKLYIIPKNESFFTIPFHRCYGSISISKVNLKQNFPSDINHLDITASRIVNILSRFSDSDQLDSESRNKNENMMIKSALDEIIVRGPGMVHLSAYFSPFDLQKIDNYDVDIEIKLLTTISDRPVILKTSIPYPWEQDTCPI